MNILSMMKNAKKMQAMMQEQQAKLAETIVTGEAGAGAVSISLDCKYNAKKVVIANDFLQDNPMPENKEILEDLTLAALTDALNKVAEHIQGGMGGLAEMFGGDLGDLGDLMGGGK